MTWSLSPPGRARPTPARPGASVSVTSARRPVAHVANRFFPKTRSWFVLHAPIQLLSPRSVLRVLFALAAVAWLVIGSVGFWGAGSRLVVLLGAALVVALWMAVLARVRVAPASVIWFALPYVAVLGAEVWSTRGGATGLVFLAFFVPMGVAVALFSGTRAVLGYAAACVVVLGVALVPADGWVHAGVIALVAGTALGVGPLCIDLLVASERRQGSIDLDTGLPNALGLACRIPEMIAGGPLVVTVVLLEGVEDAREAFGYTVGTELLRRVVEDLGQMVPSGTLIGRVEGDELVIAAPLECLERAGGGRRPDIDPADPADPVRSFALALARAVEDTHVMVEEIGVMLRARVGIVTVDTPAPSDPAGEALTVVRHASLAARRAAATGLALLRWDGNDGALTVEDLALLADLGAAARNGELSLAYQPQWDPRTGRSGALEALIRWDSPVHGSVPPGRFIPLAERTGLVDQLTTWVIGEALDAQVRRRALGLELPVSVNLSAKNLSDPELAGRILAELAVRSLPPSSLTVEVTETAAAEVDQAELVLRPLHDFGVRVSIDDFGTGYTSLAALPSLPVDELKVDQRFVLRSGTSPADAAIVRTVRELAGRLGLDAVAEGVETEEIAQRLVAWGFDYLQGYHFARPMSEEAVARFLAAEARTCEPGSPLPLSAAEPDPPPGRRRPSRTFAGAPRSLRSVARAPGPSHTDVVVTAGDRERTGGAEG